MQMMMLTSILSTYMRWRRAQVSRVGGKFDQLLRSTEIMDSLLTNDAYSVGVFFSVGCLCCRSRGSCRRTRFRRF